LAYLSVRFKAHLEHRISDLPRAVRVSHETADRGALHSERRQRRRPANRLGGFDRTTHGRWECHFGLQSTGQGDSEAAVPLGPTGGNDLYIPFDYSPGYSTGIAFAEPALVAATVSASIHDEFGEAIPAAQTITVPSHGHYSDALAVPFPGVQQKRGVAHFSSINLYGLGIRANGKAFTSIEALAGVPSGSKTIPHGADGGGWRMTFLLVNTDFVFQHQPALRAEVPLQGVFVGVAFRAE
jgi:hypothetical protein